MNVHSIVRLVQLAMYNANVRRGRWTVCLKRSGPGGYCCTSYKHTAPSLRITLKGVKQLFYISNRTYLQGIPSCLCSYNMWHFNPQAIHWSIWNYFNKLFTLLHHIVLPTEANQWEIMCKIISRAVFSLKKREVPDGPGNALKTLLGLLRDCSA